MGNVYIVVGLGFGDEGKGVVSSCLARQARDPLVIRFNGGHQAGHTVVKGEDRHVFSSFGSGTMHGAPTYLSPFCTVYPTAVVNEYRALEKFEPRLIIDPLCPITTPFDVRHNQYLAQHGTVGVGFGTTLRRQKNHYALYAKDLKYPNVLREKLTLIQDYYQQSHLTEEREQFLEDVDTMLSLKKVVVSKPPAHKGDIIMEGAQGILLDQLYGFFPYVTPSNTTSKNALELMSHYGGPVEIFLVTRAYHTRHGMGPFPGEESGGVILKGNHMETNITNAYQGAFRTAPLNVELLQYAFDCERQSSGEIAKRIVMTCCDQVEHVPDIEHLFPTVPILYNSSAEGNFLSSLRPGLRDKKNIVNGLPDQKR